VHQLLEFRPRWRAVVLLKQSEPLRCITGNVERGQEDLAGVFRSLNVEELRTPIEPRQRVLRSIIRQEQQLMVVVGRRGDGVTAGLS
jgi:hypothetical protein